MLLLLLHLVACFTWNLHHSKSFVCLSSERVINFYLGCCDPVKERQHLYDNNNLMALHPVNAIPLPRESLSLVFDVAVSCLLV